VTEELRMSQSEALRDLYRSTSVVRRVKCSRLRWAGNVITSGITKISYRILVKSLGKQSLGR
jgi:hypothetical protein